MTDYTYKKVLNLKTGRWEFKRTPYDAATAKPSDPVFENIVPKNDPGSEEKMSLKYDGTARKISDMDYAMKSFKKTLYEVTNVPNSNIGYLDELQKVMAAMAPMAKVELELNPVLLVDDPEKGLIEASRSQELRSVPTLPPEAGDASEGEPDAQEGELEGFSGRVVKLD